ncbi:hypothetical protein CB1_000884040 [Camelus ferus]|nr:hypothetical protein CB1_000884040 [Camelus ferus]
MRLCEQSSGGFCLAAEAEAKPSVYTVTLLCARRRDAFDQVVWAAPADAVGNGQMCEYQGRLAPCATKVHLIYLMSFRIQKHDIGLDGSLGHCRNQATPPGLCLVPPLSITFQQQPQKEKSPSFAWKPTVVAPDKTDKAVSDLLSPPLPPHSYSDQSRALKSSSGK